jgi:hypothetical protein
MSNSRYPENLAVSVEDFLASGWKQTVDSATREGYSAMWGVLSEAARSAIEHGHMAQGKVLWLLADACSMMLSPANHNEPFKPVAVFHDRRSVIPDDLPDSDIAFFTQVVDFVDDVWLKARLADLVWLKVKPRNTAFALTAIDAYRSLPLDVDTWIRGGDDCWRRAISLARMLNAGAGDRLEEMEVAITVAFNAASKSTGFLCIWLADLLSSSGLGRSSRADVARKLEALAREFDAEGDLQRAGKYFSAAKDWYKRVPDEVKSAEMTVAVAENFAKEAAARSASEGPSHMVAASLYENAIQTYRQVPRTQRSTHRVDERIVELRKYLNQAGEKSIGEMGVVRTPGVDITQIVENARSVVRGKSAQEALLAFANLHSGAKVEELRNSARERMCQFPLQSLFAATVMSRDGRVVAKRPAMGLGGESTDEGEIAIRAEMVRDFGIMVSIVVQGDIWPALEVLLLEHRLRESDFISLARQSPIVPKERVDLFGKALFAGYERDFVVALHLLIPQIEHMVRIHLKQVGAKTTNIDKDGIENENGMSTLMDLPEAELVFGKDLAFELRSLYCDAFGSNLRNEVAHGLLDADGFHSPSAIYAWWLALRITVNTWWNAARRLEQAESAADSETS